MAKKLTRALIENTKAHGRDVMLWDSQVPGFLVRVSRSGVKGFYVRYRIAGKTNRKALGSCDVVDLDAAREQARKILEAIALGKKISDVVYVPVQGFTVADLAVEHQRVHNVAESTRALYRIYWEKHIVPALGTKRVAELTKLDVQRWHTRLGSSQSVTANRCLTRLKHAFNDMRMWGNGWPRLENPCEEIESFGEEAIENILTSDQAKRLVRELELRVEVRPTNMVAWLCLALMLSGLRRDELRVARWEWIDLETGVLTIPKTKRQVRRIVALDVPVMDLLRRIPNVGKFVFSNASGTAPINKPGAQWRSIKKCCGIDPGFRLHDLRHTFASVALNEGGLSIKEVSELLHHASVQTTMRYLHLVNDQARAARSRAGAAIAARMTESPPSEAGARDRPSESP